MTSQTQIARWGKQVVVAWRKRLRGAESLFGVTQQKAFLAEEVLSLMRTVDEVAGDRLTVRDFVAVHNAALSLLRFDYPKGEED